MSLMICMSKMDVGLLLESALYLLSCCFVEDNVVLSSNRTTCQRHFLKIDLEMYFWKEMRGRYMQSGILMQIV
jgi:hypothetical protein